jgi:hypothetical protein
MAGGMHENSGLNPLSAMVVAGKIIVMWWV